MSIATVSKVNDFSGAPLAPEVREDNASHVLKVDRLSAGFESRVIFRSLSFDVLSNGLVALLGPAGVGKSTLLRTLCRWNEPRPSFWVHGHVWHEGRDLLHDVPLKDARRKVALLAQKARLFTASILENAIADVGKDLKLSFSQKRELAKSVLAPWDLWDELKDALDEKVTTLSIARQRMLTIARLTSGGAECLLVDELTRDVNEHECDDLRDLLRRAKSRCAVVMATHDQREARDLADWVCLITAGRLVEFTPAQEFFREPRTELGRQYLRTGNCWPLEPEPSSLEGGPAQLAQQAQTNEKARVPSWLPTPEERAPRPGGFHWVLPDLLGGMQWPGLLTDEATDLAGLAKLNVRHLVTLTELPFEPERLAPYGIVGIHFPIVDMGVPTFAEASTLCQQISQWIDEGKATVLHCRAGLGRTGTMLACVLIVRGVTAVRAVHEVRQVNPLYIQSEAQLEFIGEFGRLTAQ